MMAKEDSQKVFTSIHHVIDIDWLREAFHATRKGGAPGVDNRTWQDYEANLEENLQDLLDRAKSGRYVAPPVRRKHIPKGISTTETRPIGIPTIEDKVLQRAVVMVLEPIYEQDFYDCSYGFRPKRSAHQALDSFWKQAMDMNVSVVLEVDIRKYFDRIDHKRLREFLHLRVRDGVLLRLIGKWLNAGVMEDGQVHYPNAGTPQGGVVSPILSNVFLHYVLDAWFHEEVLPRLGGRAFIIRFADDFVIGFERERDAERVHAVLEQRLSKYGLEIHPTKTKRVPFERPRGRSASGTQRPGTFSFLGFTHYWSRSRRGNWIIKRRTEKSRLARCATVIDDWCRKHRHLPIKEQHKKLSRKLQGHYAYYGITGNSISIARFRDIAAESWLKWLGRRSRKAERTWKWYALLKRRYPLPPARAIHSIYHVANS
jgi:group II intron reverse transcriptase/maturase